MKPYNQKLSFKQKLITQKMGNQVCKTCQFVQNTNQLRNQKIDPALLKPIQFSDQGSECPENDNHNQKQHRKQGSTLSALVGEDSSLNINIRKVPPKSSELQPDPHEQIRQLGMESKASKLKQYQQSFQQDLNEIKVPFSVIKLIIKPGILDQFRKIQKQFQKNFASPTAHSFHTWKLQSNGIYTNNISDGTTVILTQNSLYKGWTKIRQFVPQNVGFLIKQGGCYQGNFIQGLAHGKGTYITADGRKKFTGKWHKGKLVSGKIQCQNYTYDGQLEDSKPSGRGFLIAVDSRGYQLFRYNGNFKNGKFQGNGKYQCPKYIYTGKFHEGTKNGFGVLVERYTGQQKKRKKPQSLIEGVKRQGEWKDDKLINVKKSEIK